MSKPQFQIAKTARGFLAMSATDIPTDEAEKLLNSLAAGTNEHWAILVSAEFVDVGLEFAVQWAELMEALGNRSFGSLYVAEQGMWYCNAKSPEGTLYEGVDTSPGAAIRGLTRILKGNP